MEDARIGGSRSCLTHLRLFDASNGFEETGERRAEHVDDRDEGRGVSVAASTRAGGPEESVQGRHAGVGFG